MRARLVFPLILTVVVLLFLVPLWPTAERLPILVQPSHYDLAFDVDLVRARFEGTESINVRVDEPTASIVLHAADLTIHEAFVRTGASEQKATVRLDKDAETATLTVPRRLAAGAAEIRIRFSGTLNNELRGFYLSQANGRNYAITQFESTDARRAFPCFDEPSLKATFALKLTLDQGDTAISNGRVVSDTPGPGNARHTLTFATSPKMSTYLVAMAVGDFQCLEGSSENIPIRVCATPDKKELGHIALDWTRQLLTFFNNYYSIDYPFGKLDMVAVPDFAAGAMENTAAIFYREADLLADSATASVLTRKNIASILAHEMAHQWFGNIVTMRWWDDLWLNEGFATWMANRPLDALMPDWNVAVDEVDETRTALNLDALATTRAIHSNVETPAQIEESFDAIAYEKGAAVLRMVEGYVGPELFKQAINAYLEKFAYGNATSENFWSVIASVSGKPVDRILPTFVNQPGAPVVDVSLACRDGRTELSLRQNRFSLETPTATTRGQDAWQIPLCIKTPGQSAAACQVFAAPTATIAAGNRCEPWVFVNAGARGYFRTAYSPEMLRALAPSIESSLTAPERSSLADDEWALVRAGRHNVADFMTLASGFRNEHIAAVLSQITSRLEYIHDYLASDNERPRLAAWVRGLLTPLSKELGVATTPGDPDSRRALRAVVINALGTFGADPAIAANARSMLDRALANPGVAAAQLDASTANAIVRVAARHGDRALFDALLAASARAASPDEHYRYLYALTAFEDPELSQRALEYSLSPDLRRQDTSLYVARFLSNPAVSARAWTFVKQHWSELQPKMTMAFGETRVVEATGSFCTAQARDDVRQFFAGNKVSTAARTIRQTIERIDNCIAFRDRQTPALAQWLSQG